MTRKALQAIAREAGEKYFEDPKGCKHGHTLFYTCNAGCVMCAGARPLLTFARYADANGLTGRERDVAESAWMAAKGTSPVRKEDLLRAVAKSRQSAKSMAASLSITGPHAARLLRTLEREGLVKRHGTNTRTLLWSLA